MCTNVCIYKKIKTYIHIYILMYMYSYTYVCLGVPDRVLSAHDVHLEFCVLLVALTASGLQAMRRCSLYPNIVQAERLS